VDRRGRIFVEDRLDAPLPAATPVASASTSLTGALLPLDQTFSLHSRPGAQRTIYLNFKGAVLNNTAWNSGSTITALPFDLDGIPYSFSNVELERIQYIWQRVVEDYAPFDVDVTTEAPSADVLTRSSGTDQIFGTTVLITNRSGVYNCSCGGVAYLGVFDDTSDFYKPALVFYDALGPGNEKYVAEAISHEAGHNMGLAHDGDSTTGYYAGHGSGATGWAPIMGVGYYKELVQWSKGQYPGANNVQDDYGVMAGNGLPVRADDHGDTPATATVLSGSTIDTTGVIERPGDIDMFRIASGAGMLTVAVKPASRSANLDVLLELRDANGAVLASANPADLLTASLSASVPAGTYYIAVTGTGKGDPLNGGYTNYGSLGQYAVSGTVPAASGQPPVAAASATPTSGTVPLNVAFSSSGSFDPDGVIAGYEWNFGDGTAPATGATANHVYNTAGSYSAVLKVTDNSGLTASRSVTITANPQIVVSNARVADIAMSLVVSGGRNARATAAVTVRDVPAGPPGQLGQVIAGATVAGTWSGIVSGSASAVGDSNGVATLQSPTTKTRGTFSFTVTSVTIAGYTYTPTANTETSDSITR
ncbi:MAG: PKD domain-containing protein, partial [Burkholderiaceae bacterium]